MTESFGDSSPAICADADFSVKKICEFLCEYAALLLGSGATCIRLEHNVNRMAGALNCKAVMTVLPRHIHITVCREDCNDSFTYTCGTPHVPISYDVNTRLSRLSWALADGRINFPEACREFEVISRRGSVLSQWTLIAVAFANAAFCRLFEGDWYAVGVVFLSTLAGFYLKQVLMEKKVDVRIIVTLCAFVSSVLAAGASLFSIGTTPHIAVATSVLYLVPGIPFLNSFSDMISGNYICSFCRFTEAVILTGCLSIGLCCGLLVMNLGMF